MLKIIKLKTWLKRAFVLSILLIISFLLLDFFYPLPIDDFKKRSFAQVVVDQGGHPLRAFPDSKGVWRYPVELSEVSPLYLQALINYEDRYFYQHFGVNPLAIIRAFGQWIWHGELVSGASTLTMQVARVLKPHKKSFSGKLQQMFMALQLEWHFDKDEILNYYVNYAPFGGTIEGVEAASFAYFGKTSAQLTHSEAALLAVMPQSPSRFRPDRYPERAKKARNKLLSRLQDFAIWDKKTIEDAKQEQVWAQFNTRPMIAPLHARLLRKQFPNQQVIKSTIDISLQTELEMLVSHYTVNMPEKMSAALLLVNNHDMSVKAYIGSADFLNKTRGGHVDMIQAIRSPGSTLKPFIYGMAIDQGIIHSESLLFDVPQSFNGYRPKNFTDTFNGPVSVSQALGRSLNMPAVQVLNELSPQVFYATLKNAGLSIKLPDTAKPNLTLALGGGGVNLQQLVGVFSSLGRKGYSSDVRYVKDQKLSNFPLLSEGTAWIVQNILSQVPIKTVRSRHFNLASPMAYKTGTSYGFRDAWVIASNAHFTVGIWLGQANGSFLESNSGRTTAVPLLQQVLAIMPDKMMQKPKQPLNVNNEIICWPTGMKSVYTEGKNCHQSRTATLLNGTAPPSLKDTLTSDFSSGLVAIQLDKLTNKRVLPNCFRGDLVTTQLALWPMVLDPWLAIPYRRQSLLPKFNDECKVIQSTSKLEITGIHDNAILYPEANTNTMPDVSLQVNGAVGQSYWFVNGVLQKQTDEKLTLKNLESGKYTIIVIDNSGNYSETGFSVRM